MASQKGAIDITSPRSFFLLETIKVKGKREEKKKNKGRHKIESVCSIAPALSLRSETSLAILAEGVYSRTLETLEKLSVCFSRTNSCQEVFYDIKTGESSGARGGFPKVRIAIREAVR